MGLGTKEATITGRPWLKEKFTKQNASKINKGLNSVIGPGRSLENFSKRSLIFSAAFTAYRSSKHLDAGDSVPKALAKGALSYASIKMFPQQIPLSIARGVTEAYPDMKNAKRSQKEASLNYRTMGGGYQESQADYASRARAMETIQRSKMPSPGGEARAYHRTP